MASEGTVRGTGWQHWMRAQLAYDRNVYLLLTYTMGKGLQLTIGAVTINLYALSLGFHADFIGVLTGISAIGVVIVSVPVGLLADRIGRRPLIWASAALTPLTLIAVAFSTSGPLLLTASFFNGLLATAYWITNLPMLTESTTEEQRVGVLALNSFLLLGVGALGSLIGGLVPEIVGHITHQAAVSVIPMRFGVLAAAVVAAVPAIPLIFLRESQRVKRPTTPIVTTSEDAGADATIPRARMSSKQWGMVALFAMLLIPDVLFVMGESLVVGLLQVFFRLRFHIEPGTLGIILLVTGLIGGGMALIAPRIVRHWGKLRTITAVQFLTVPIMLVIGFAPFLAVATAAELSRSILRGLLEPIYAAFAMESVPAHRRATLSGFYGLTWGVGFSMGA